MRAGPRDRLIVIERATITTDDYGGQVETWATFASEYAQVIYGKGEERRQAAQESSSLAATFRVLENDKTRAVLTTDRISFDGGVYDITSNVPLGRDGRELTGLRAT